MQKLVHLHHPDGLNSVAYELVEEDKIQCVSDRELSLEDMRIIEELLNVDLRLGMRCDHKEEMTRYGQYVTSWSFIVAHDSDWR